MNLRVRSLFKNIFEKASLWRVGGVLFLAVLMLLSIPSSISWADSNPSNDSGALSIRIRPKDNFKPSPVTDLDAAVMSNEGEVLLQWTAPKPDDVDVPGPGPVSNYFVRYATFSVSNLGGNTTNWWNMSSDVVGEPSSPQNHPNNESFILTGLEPGATLYFGIRSDDALGNLSLLDLLAQYGAQANAIVPDSPPPVVTGLGLSVSTDSINISWAASTATDVANYQIYMDSTSPGDVYIPTVTVPVGTNNYTFTNLVAQNTYFFYVTALDKGQPAFLGNVLESTPSSTVNAFPTAIISSPTAPTNFGAVAIATNSITWQWLDNANNETGFRLYSSTGMLIATLGSSPGTGASAQYTETGLSPNVSYSRYVVAFEASLDSLPSGTTARFTLANPPSGTNFTAVFSSSVILNWTANNNSAGTVYNVQRSSDAAFVQIAFQTTVTALTFADANLFGNTTYFYRVRAENGEGTASGFDNVISTKTLQSLAQGLTATPGDKLVALDWDDSADPAVTGYFVYSSSISLGGPFKKINLTALTSTYYLDAGLINGVTYYYGVTTVDAGASESALSNIVSARPRKPVAQRPQEPTGLFGTLSSTGVFSLSWTAVNLDIIHSTTVELSSYRLYKSSSIEGPFFYRDSVAPSSTTWTASELVPPTVWYLVRAVDTSDNESNDSMHVETLKIPVLSAVSDDATARVELSGEDTNIFRAATNGRSEDVRVVVARKADEERGNTMASYEIKSFGAISGSEIKDIKFKRPTVNLQFRFTKGIKAPYLKPGTSIRYAGSTLKDVSIFWHNSVEFVKFGGAIDPWNGVVSVKTASPLGKYQVRQVLRGTDFAITQITPRKIFTPNGDGVNDEIILFLENPNDAVIAQARIFDLTGAEVADFEQGIVAGAQGVVSLKWNGKDRSGNYVRSGVYIYQVQAEGKTLNGTMVVAR